MSPRETRVLRVVSIHASRCWEAMRGGMNPMRTTKRVSIHASRCWEAMRAKKTLFMATKWFQSTPPVAGRRCTWR